MGKLKQRLTITPHGTLLGWRRLQENKLAYSGQLRLTRSVMKQVSQLPRFGYVSYLEFDFITHWPALQNRWEEHYLGEKDGIFVILPVSEQSKTVGPMI